MRRREFIAGSAATAATAFAQPIWAQTNRSIGVKRLAMFHSAEPPEGQTPSGRLTFKAYFAELNRLGYIEGQNLTVERYSALGQPNRIADLARQIVASRPDVILAISGPFIKEVIEMTSAIPMIGPTADPVTYGLTTSLARPDRNFTGVVLDSGVEIWGKRVQLLLEAARSVTKLGFLNANPLNPAHPQGYGAYISEAARRSGIAVAYFIVAGTIDRAAIERAGIYAAVMVVDEKVDRTACEKSFHAMEKEGVDALIVGDPADFLTYGQLIADLAARSRMPAIYPLRAFVQVGGLMAYGIDGLDLMRRIAQMTAQVLGGEKPSDIPFYRQTKYELVLNQKAATSLGLEFPATLLTAADEVID